MLSPLVAIGLLTYVCLASPLSKRSTAFIDPRLDGGSMLDSSAGLGEPLNVIISGLSSADVLTDDGLLTYVRAIGYSEECLGIHIGTPQTANLGDGQGSVNQLAVIRQSIDDIPILGTCLETLEGGNHFRYWRQETTGALFLAVSTEENITESHDIIPNGYDIGRDTLATAAAGTHDYILANKKYTTTVEVVTGLLPIGSAGINHNISIDGIVKVFTVTSASIL